MKKTIAVTMAVSLLLPGTMASALTPGVATGAANCVLTKKSDGSKVPAICGFKVDPVDHQTRKYRNFTLDGIIYEQFQRPTDTNPDNMDQFRFRLSDGSSLNEAYSRPSESDDSQGSSTFSKTLIIGGAIVAVGGAFVGTRAMIKASRAKQPPLTRRQAEANYYARAERGAIRPAGVPESVTLGKDVPYGSGQSVRVSGTVPKNDPRLNGVPTFTSTTGQRIAILNNPQTSRVETIIITDSGYPYYFPGSYMYPTFVSPYAYDSGSNVIVNETIINNPDVLWDSAKYNSDPVVPDNTGGDIYGDTDHAWTDVLVGAESIDPAQSPVTGGWSPFGSGDASGAAQPRQDTAPAQNYGQAAPDNNQQTYSQPDPTPTPDMGSPVDTSTTSW